MLISDSREATITLLDYLAILREGLDTPDLLGISNDDEVADLYSDVLKYITNHNLLDADSVLYNTLNTIDERLTTAELRIDTRGFSTLLDSLAGYVGGDRLKDHAQSLASYLPAVLADKYATMLRIEAGLLSASDSSGTALEGTSHLQQTDSVTGYNTEHGNADASEESAFMMNTETPHGTPSSMPHESIPKPLQAAMQFTIEELQELLTTEDPASESGISREAVENHLDNLAFIAESIGAENFLHELSVERALVMETTGESALLHTASLAELLNKLEGLIHKDIVSDSESADEATVYPGHSSSSEDLIFTDERLGMLHEELSYFDDQLHTQALIITDENSNAETMFTYVAKYSELMERLVKACEALGLQGLKRICNFVIENINLLPTISADNRPELRSLLQRWPQMVKRYLVDPADDATLMGLIDLMQDKLWPSCFDGLDSRDLYAELSNGAAADSETESDKARTAEVTPDDVSLSIGADINPQLLDSYLLESPDVAAQFSQVISTLASSANPLEGVRAAQRLSHTLKGSANLVGIKGIANLSHHIEDILDILSRKGITPSSSLIALLQEAADCLEGMLDAVAGLDSPPEESAAVLKRVIDVANRIYTEDFDPSVDLPLPSESMTSPSVGQASESSPGQTALSAANSADTLRVPTGTIDSIFRLVEEVTISLAQLQERVNRIRYHSDMLNKHDRNLQLRRFDLENLVDVRSIATMQKRLHRGLSGDAMFDPLELDQYDKLHGATHSYIESVADARQISNTMHSELVEIERLMTRHSRLNKELQHLVSATRLVPISNINSRLHRTVRQAARATGKAAELTIEHHNLLMDGDVLNKLIEPLSHILRNAVDHGMPETAEGTQSGRVTITYGQEGNSMVIRCTDDGKGLDYARIREVAVERGLIHAEDETSREELAQLIMSPSFTTRRSATHISGRGIGLDAALTAVTELKGSITVRDVNPHGTEFVINLPLSLVTTHTLVVQAGGVVYAIPTTALSRILPAKRGEIVEAEGGTTLQFNGEVYPLKTLTSLVEGEISSPSSSNPMLLSAHGTTPTAIAIDVLVDSFELVIKRLGRLAPRVPGVIGVSVLSDGQLVPVLDIPGLLSGVSDRTNALAPNSAGGFTARPSAARRDVLIVDDSLSARNSLAHLLEDGGYSVLSARDGVEAVELLQRAKPLVVLADMEMPRMDGIELTRHIRANKELSELPVVMITSRSQKKHRDVAQAAGVSAYVTKPFVDNELIDLVSSLVAQHEY